MAALEAARAALRSIEALNREETGARASTSQWQPLDLGIALHRGPVFYGNIGAHHRLDFTVTGPVVNLAARIEPLAKTTGRRLLLTTAVADLLDEPVDALGRFDFHGLAEPVAVFAARE